MEVTCKELADRILGSVKTQVKVIGKSPTLSVYYCSCPETEGYIKSKLKAAEKVGIMVKLINCDNLTKDFVYDLIHEDNSDGIIVQLPWKTKEDGCFLTHSIPTCKDVDGLTYGSCHTPATALGIYNLLDQNNVFEVPNHIVLVGRSKLVGDPLAKLLLQEKNVTLSVLNSRTNMFQEILELGDVIITATGKQDLIGPWMEFGSGTLIVDAGFSKDDFGNIHGDVAKGMEEQSEGEIDVTPVPGGVGLLTVAYLLSNVVDAHNMQQGYEKTSKTIE